MDERLAKYRRSGGTPALIHVSKSPANAYEYLLCNMKIENIKLTLVSLMRLYKTVDTHTFTCILQTIHRL